MKMFGAKLLRMFVLFCMLMSYMPLAFSQSTTNGAVEGRVYQSGNPGMGVAGATVLVRNQESGLERSVLSDPNGNYFCPGLPPGDYTITVTATGYETHAVTAFQVRLSKSNPVIPPIGLRSLTVGVTPPPAGTPPGARPQTTTTPSTTPSGVAGYEQLTNTSNAGRGDNFDRRTLIALPLPGVRTVDDLAFLSPGVAPPPQAIGTSVGPGIGAGVGTSGQFSVNGMRSRANNFTIDGSDNNDEDIGVRRQGFTSLTPQPIDSLQEFQIITLLPEPQFGRKPGAQVNAVSRAGGAQWRGTAYGSLTNRALRARDPFDFTGGPSTYPITEDGRQVLLNGQPLAPGNPVGDESAFNQGRFGIVLGGPIVKPNTSLFISAEHQQVNASKEAHFAVPTVAERGVFQTGATGLNLGSRIGVFPTSAVGDAIFSLFPFPNNPVGPYGPNTFTEVLPASAHGNVFSVRVDQQNINAFGKNHTLAGRYNFTDDDTTLPVTGEALFSTLRAKVRTQNLSLILDSTLSLRATNQFRFSYGRTSLGFNEVRDPFLLPAGQGLDKTEFLLNARLVANGTLPGSQPRYVTANPAFTTNTCFGPDFRFPNTVDTEPCTGILGQVIVSGYSPVGVDVFNFPQGRTNNTFQYADTVIYNRSIHRITAGADIRRIQLNSFLDRNSRPLATFRGAINICTLIPDLCNVIRPGAPQPPFLFGSDFAAAGAPTGFYQTQALFPDSTIGLRNWQNAFFFSDQVRVTPRFTLTFGLRYDLSTVPTEVNRRIENTFDSQDVKNFIALEKREFGRSGLEQFLDGRSEIFQLDKNNFAPHIAFAWDPFGNGTTSIRAGYGIYYDTIPGAVISQSRNVFPSFLSTNTAGFQFGTNRLEFFNPQNLAQVGTLNTFDRSLFENALGTGDLSEIYLKLAEFSNFSGGPAFVLPSNDVQTPYAHHWGLTVEHQFRGDYLLSAGYVGTTGVHLLRFATPNLGLNAIPVVTGLQFDATLSPGFLGLTIPPAGERPFPLLGSFTSIESDANSSYHALQLQAVKRFSRRYQFTTAYTWSHAIDEVSDLFDLAGSTALPQDSFDRRAERADANFDVRHRFVYSFIWDLPLWEQSKIWGGWQFASIGTFQTGQPYSLLFCCEINQDGNLTDRITPGLTLAGSAPRNSLRAPGIQTVDVSLNKMFRFSERQNLEFRTEVFNLANHPNFGIPLHQLFFGGFNIGIRPATEDIFIDTRVPSRTIQFGLKFNF
jgi:hypothetical protein